MAIQSWFPTLIYYDRLHSSLLDQKKFHEQLLLEIQEISERDIAGKSWSKINYKNGFTSYASVNDLHRKFAAFTELEKKINRHLKKYIRALGYDCSGRKIEMTTCWVNIMKQNTYHGLHLHPQSVISGTYYLEAPSYSSAIKFEDPRLDRMMIMPNKSTRAPKKNKIFCEYPAREGYLVLFESWLRHEVPLHTAKKERISISFNFA